MQDSYRTNLQGELNQLRTLIDSLPESAVIERSSLEARLKQVESEIRALDARPKTETAVVTFRGDPILGSRGIAADFAGKAIGGLSEFFGAVVAGRHQEVQSFGPIPSKGQPRPYIVGTERGSFGFKFEFPPPSGLLFTEPAGPSSAMDHALQLLQIAATGSDDELTDVMEAVQSRAVRKAYDFINTIETSGATVELRSLRSRIVLHDPASLRTIIRRLREDNIHETVDDISAQIVGALPNDRTFEAETNEGQTIKGKVGTNLSPEQLNKDWLYKPAKLTIQTTQVGSGRARNVLTAIEGGLSDSAATTNEPSG